VFEKSELFRRDNGVNCKNPEQVKANASAAELVKE
jgi:hypothetical protein